MSYTWNDIYIFIEEKYGYDDSKLIAPIANVLVSVANGKYLSRFAYDIWFSAWYASKQFLSIHKLKDPELIAWSTLGLLYEQDRRYDEYFYSDVFNVRPNMVEYGSILK